MSQLLPINTENASITMSSREIAEIVESRHSDVKRSIERLIEKGVIQGYTPLPYTHQQNGQTYYEYHLFKRDTYIVVAQLCPEFTARLVDRWQELENQQKTTALSLSRKELALMVIQAEEENERLQLENKQKSEQIESMETYFKNGISPFDFVKGLNGVNSLKVGEHLVNKNWLYEEQSSSYKRKRVTSYARDRYLTEENIQIAPHSKDPFIAYKPVLLKKGAAKLYEMYVRGELPMKKTWNGEYTQSKVVGL